MLTGALFLLAPAANMLGTSRFFYWLHDMAACFYFGVDMENGLHDNFPSHLTDGTSHSSSDFLHDTSVLPFSLMDKTILSPTSLPCSLWTKICYVKVPSSFCSSWTKNTETNSKLAKVFLVNLFSDFEKVPYFPFTFHTLAA